MTESTRTPEILRYVAVFPLHSGSATLFDRAKNRAVVRKFLGILPVGHTKIALTDIDDVQVCKRETIDGRIRYGIILRVRFGGDVRFWCTSRDKAMTALHEILHFLHKEQATAANKSTCIQ